MKAIEETQAVVHAKMQNLSTKRLVQAGAKLWRGYWVFPDGSRGKCYPPQGRLKPVYDDIES